MKKFWFLFSIFLLSLVVYPCRDRVDCENNLKAEICKHKEKTNKNQEIEHCTPFCNCSHCPTTVFFMNALSYSIKNNEILLPQKKRLSFYSSIYSKKLAYKIWQPPKIS